MLLTNEERIEQARIVKILEARCSEAIARKKEIAVKTKAQILQSSGYVQTSLVRTLQKEKLARDGFYATTKPTKQYEHLKPRKKDSVTVVKKDGSVYELTKKK